ncbi:rhomboid family intramembrane serine protease [Dyadobacter sediminis]|uniref:Rhomboid family intramembrane serine protease n=1 Tax=Dyadobacter sediminis TaxID=1493691 RepID=A0A5R9K7U5_9BACT|nr:rhomboid family intramembrane serine protease [Dyadobacter sediminis]TLU89953.1 rhomboid family intramembrane serine protease [Dyadobacter sediminis]GGC11488.1 rhomboid family intramembrane serine protease [Dyadobacter sediminis]
MSITLLLIIITCGISYYAFNNPDLMDRLILNPYRITSRNEYYRFVTSGFIHADFGHLIFNMLSLWFVGEGIERLFGMLFGSGGSLYFLFLYLVGIIVSDIPTFLKHRNSSSYNSLGASGGVSAVLFAAILFAPTMTISLYFFIRMKAFIFGILFLGYSFYEAKKGTSYVNHSAHMYGAIFGMVFMAVVYPASVPGFFAQIGEWIGTLRP